jgi:hypothetical protein
LVWLSELSDAVPQARIQLPFPNAPLVIHHVRGYMNAQRLRDLLLKGHALQ